MTPYFLLLSLSLLGSITLAQRQRFDCGRPYTSVDDSSESAELPTSRGRRQRQATFPHATDPASNPPLSTYTPIETYAHCGAVVISDRFLLTAAYCVLDPANPVSSVVLGDLDLSKEGEPNSQPAEYQIELIIVHPNFTQNPETNVRYNDLALLKTTRRIQFNEAVYPYCLSSRRLPPGTTVTASGFGHVNETHMTTHLQEGELQIMGARDCEATYRANNKETVLKQAYPALLDRFGIQCAGHPERAACRGDEGGPLTWKDPSGRLYLEGIISFTSDVCDANAMPSVYVSVADNYDFIMQTIRQI